MSADHLADTAPLLIILIPLLIAMIASMKPERPRPSTRADPDHRVPHSSTEHAARQKPSPDQ
jgi:hypothetical protein